MPMYSFLTKCHAFLLLCCQHVCIVAMLTGGVYCGFRYDIPYNFLYLIIGELMIYRHFVLHSGSQNSVFGR